MIMIGGGGGELERKKNKLRVLSSSQEFDLLQLLNDLLKRPSFEMKNAAKNKRESKKRYNKLNREKKRARRVEEMAAAAAAQNAIPRVHLAESGPNNATNHDPATNRANDATNQDPATNRANDATNQDPATNGVVFCASCINTTFGKERREPVGWTLEEEAMLKALLLKHKKSFKKPGPWANMLQEGRSVFNKCRTGGDLRDNILPYWLKKEEEEEEEEEAHKHQNRA